jgi:4-diphosphocytidyl-2-C-methyl-D-erythritol kinase
MRGKAPKRARGVRIKAFAKINLTLRVLGARSDGYHDLRTTFQALALHDTLTFTPTRGPFQLECDDAACPSDATNLVWRAADRLWRASGREGEPSGVTVRIEKRIPLQAGLGGGSSDGAAALRALAALWKIRLNADRLRMIAAELGADVPFFLEGGTALGINRGDVIFPLIDWQPSWVVLVIPAFGVSTADAFKWFDTWNAGREPHHARGRSVDKPGPYGEAGNDLQPAVEARNPEIGQMAESLARGGASYAAMSGSGSAVFGLFDDEETAESAASALKDSSRRALITRTLGRTAFARLSHPVYL